MNDSPSPGSWPVVLYLARVHMLFGAPPIDVWALIRSLFTSPPPR